MPYGSKWIRPDKRLAVYLRDGFCCAYCGADLHGANPRNITLEHLKQRSEGGSNDPRNLTTACLSCNSSRGARGGPWTLYAIDPAEVRRRCRRSLKRYIKLARELRRNKGAKDAEENQ